MIPHGQRSRWRRGVSLVEVMIAVTILAFALLPLFLFVRTGARGVTGTRDIATATFLASQALESVRAWPFERLTDEDLQQTGAPGPSAEATLNSDEQSRIAVGRIEFRRLVEIDAVGQGPTAPSLKLVKVRVEWTGQKDTPLHYEVTSAVTRAP